VHTLPDCVGIVVVDSNIILLAGPNGAGKSTAAPDLLHGALHVDEFVNADVIARGLSAFNPEGAALEAGRVMLSRLKELAAQRKNIAFESTLASRTFAPWIRPKRVSTVCAKGNRSEATPLRNDSSPLPRGNTKFLRTIRAHRGELALLR
jgi:hypothetical protein